MRKLAVLVALCTVLIGSSAFALPLPLNFDGTVWQGTVEYQSPGAKGTVLSTTIVMTFETADGPNNNYISGTITGPSGAPLPSGFPTEFSAVIGPFATSLLHMTAIDTTTGDVANTLILGDFFKHRRMHTLGIRGSILGGACRNDFHGIVAKAITRILPRDGELGHYGLGCPSFFNPPLIS